MKKHMRKKGNYLNTKSERKNKRKERLQHSFRETRISIQKSAGSRLARSGGFFSSRVWRVWPHCVATECQCRSPQPHKFDIPQNTRRTAFFHSSVSLPLLSTLQNVKMAREPPFLSLSLATRRSRSVAATQFTICQPFRDPFSMC